MDFFEKYWDVVIEQWLQNMFCSKELSEQNNFALDLKFDWDSIHNRLPEPYWGDPDKCAFVIMNYNPGPCHDSRHNYRTCADVNNCMINKIKLAKYSSFAKSFPLFRDLTSSEIWFEDSIGRAWWQKQKDNWINCLLKELESNKLPFVMELSAWHSDHWHGINNSIFRKYENLINDTIFVPLINSIKKSDFGFGLCFGKRIGTEFLERYVRLGKLSSVFKGTNCAVYSFGNNYYIINYWNNINHRNRYPKDAKSIKGLLNKLSKI